MTSKLSIPGFGNEIIEFGFPVNCPPESYSLVFEDGRWFAINQVIPQEPNDLPVDFLSQKDIIPESCAKKSDKKLVLSNTQKVKTPQFNKIVESNPSQPPESDIGEFQLIEKEIVPLKFSLFSETLEEQEVQEQEVQEPEVQLQEEGQDIQDQEEPVLSDSEVELPPQKINPKKKSKKNRRKAAQTKQNSQAKKTQEVVQTELPKQSGKKKKKSQKSTERVAKTIIPVNNQAPTESNEKVLNETTHVFEPTEQKPIPKKDSYDELLEKISSDPSLFLLIDKESLSENQYKTLAKTALVLAILDKKFKDLTILEEIKKRAQEVLPKELSKLTNSEEFHACKERPLSGRILSNNHQYFLDFYDKYFNVSYDQIISMLEILQTDFTKNEQLYSAARFALTALLSVPIVARKIARGDFGEGSKDCLFYCMAYHRSDLEIFKEGSKWHPPLMLLASDSLKKSPELKDSWLQAGIKINFGKGFIFNDPRFPQEYKSLIVNSYSLLLEAIENSPSAPIYAGETIRKNRDAFANLLKNALARLLLNKDVEILYGEYKETLLSLAKKTLPTIDSKISDQNDLDSLLLGNPLLNKMLNGGGSYDVMSSWKTKFLNCSYSQFMKALEALKILYQKPIEPGKSPLKIFSFLVLVDVIEAMRAVLNYFPMYDDAATTQGTIVQLYPKNRQLVELALKTDKYCNSLIFADDSIRYDPKFKKELIQALSPLLIAMGAKELVTVTLFPKKVLDDLEILSELIKLDPKLLDYASENVQLKLKAQKSEIIRCEPEKNSPVTLTKPTQSYEELLEKISLNPSELLKIQESDWDKTQLKMFARTALAGALLENTKKVNLNLIEGIKKKAEELLPSNPSKVKNYKEYAEALKTFEYAELININPKDLLNFYNEQLDLSYNQTLTFLFILIERLGKPEDQFFAALALVPIKTISRKIVSWEFGELITKISPNCMIYHSSDLEIIQKGSQICPPFILFASDTITKTIELRPFWLKAGIAPNFDKKFVFQDSRFPEGCKDELLNSSKLLLDGIHIYDPAIIFHTGERLKTENKQISFVYKQLVKNAFARYWFAKNKEGNNTFEVHKPALFTLAEKVLPTTSSKILDQKAWDEYLKNNPEILEKIEKGGTFDVDNDFKGSFFDLSFEQFRRSLILLNLYLSQNQPKKHLFKEFFFISLINEREVMLKLLQHPNMCDSATKQLIIQQHPNDAEMVNRALKDDESCLSLYFADDSIRYAERYKKPLAHLIAFLILARGEASIKNDPRFPRNGLDDIDVIEEMVNIESSLAFYASNKVKDEPKYTNILMKALQKKLSEVDINKK